MIFENDGHHQPPKASCVIALADRLSPISEILSRLKTSVGRVWSEDIHNHLPGRHQVLVAQGIENTAPRILFNVKAASLLNLYIQLSKCTKIAKCSKALPL